MNDDLRYPVGRYTPGGQITREQRDEWIGQVAEAPALLRAAVQGLDDALGMYAWHGRHHVAHVTRLRERQGW